MRETSIEAYKALRDDGTLGERQLEALEILLRHGPMTAMELSQHAMFRGLPMGLWKRLSELRKAGIAAEVGHKKCSVTGRRVILWDVVREPKVEQLELV